MHHTRFKTKLRFWFGCVFFCLWGLFWFGVFLVFFHHFTREKVIAHLFVDMGLNFMENVVYVLILFGVVKLYKISLIL